MDKLLEYAVIFRRAENTAEAKQKRKTILAGLGLSAFLIFAASVDSIVNLLLAL